MTIARPANHLLAAAHRVTFLLALWSIFYLLARCGGAEAVPDVNATTIHNKVMCGYQGWFRAAGDAAGLGWIHWSRDSRRIAPDTICFESWPDMSAYPADQRFAAPGFTFPDGSPATLFSSDNAATVLLHFKWMQEYGIDGVWLQHFLVDLPGGRNEARYPSRLRVVHHVAAAAAETGRAWALSYDIAATPTGEVFDRLTADWKRMVDEGLTSGPRYLHEGGRPVVQIWGFYYRNKDNLMTPELGNRLLDFFAAPGRYNAFLVGGGNWDWRANPDPDWQKLYRRFPAYCPWNVGNFVRDPAGDKHASVSWWADDQKDFDQRHALWIPVVYPGFSWENLHRSAPGTSTIPRRGGKFLWEQFHALAALKPAGIYIAMFDEVDEGTAIFKITDAPPTQPHFVGTDGMPSDWHLRLVGAGAKVFRGEQPSSAEIPIKP